MSVWQPGRTYDYFGVPIVCLRRWFEGPLEMVDLAQVVAAPATATPFTRTARALAPCVKPRVTETLGGVLNFAFCDHRHHPRVVANAGPNGGLECCSGCGAPIARVGSPGGDA